MLVVVLAMGLVSIGLRLSFGLGIEYGLSLVICL
jgi:hypothetical protein